VRRDLLVDCLLALLLTIAMLVITAGLAVVALLEIPVAAATIASYVIERRQRRAPPSAHRRGSRQRA
jgi:ABC-type bacteriocin/lantibiotic exporter with double-glycine peptidase domain